MYAFDSIGKRDSKVKEFCVTKAENLKNPFLMCNPFIEMSKLMIKKLTDLDF